MTLWDGVMTLWDKSYDTKRWSHDTKRWSHNTEMGVMTRWYKVISHDTFPYLKHHWCRFYKFFLPFIQWDNQLVFSMTTLSKNLQAGKSHRTSDTTRAYLNAARKQRHHNQIKLDCSHLLVHVSATLGQQVLALWRLAAVLVQQHVRLVGIPWSVVTSGQEVQRVAVGN